MKKVLIATTALLLAGLVPALAQSKKTQTTTHTQARADKPAKEGTPAPTVAPAKKGVYKARPAAATADQRPVSTSSNDASTPIPVKPVR